jgi:2-iminobutanoate/2-iminopropanoate deaminase
VTIYLKDMSLFPRVNQVYARYVGAHPPARATVAVADLPRGADIEIAAVAYIPSAVSPEE